MRYLPWKGKTYWNLGTTFHNFRSYTKFYKNLYWFKLALSRIILKGQPEVWWIYFIFLNSRTDQDLSNKICFTNFRLELNFVQILGICSSFESNWKLEKQRKRPLGPIPGGSPLAQEPRSLAAPACGPLLCGLVARGRPSRRNRGGAGAWHTAAAVANPRQASDEGMRELIEEDVDGVGTLISWSERRVAHHGWLPAAAHIGRKRMPVRWVVEWWSGGSWS
jgi:hypothetical protein